MGGGANLKRLCIVEVSGLGEARSAGEQLQSSGANLKRQRVYGATFCKPNGFETAETSCDRQAS